MVELAVKNIEVWEKRMAKMVDRRRKIEKLTSIRNWTMQFLSLPLHV